jgi:hypothetical protein
VGTTGPAGATGATGSSATAWTTGDIKLTFKTAPDAGFVMMNDLSIGDASSGATNRANNDTVNLFTLFYNNCVDADVPIQTSTGAATTRAAQGAAVTAFGNHCRLVLPKALGRDLAVAGAGSGLTSRALGSNTGTETHTITTTDLPALSANAVFENFGTGSDSGQKGGTTGLSLLQTAPVITTGSGSMSIINPRTHLNVMVCL